MADARLDAEIERLQALLAALEALPDPAARTAARELVQVVIGLHGAGLAALLAIVSEADSQPADTLLPRFMANPTVRGLMLLHDLHPESLEVRAHKAVERLHPHLAVQGVRAELAGVEREVVRIRVSAEGNHPRRPKAEEIRREIEAAVLELTPDAQELSVEGLESLEHANEVRVPLSAISRPRRVAQPVAGDER